MTNAGHCLKTKRIKKAMSAAARSLGKTHLQGQSGQSSPHLNGRGRFSRKQSRSPSNNKSTARPPPNTANKVKMGPAKNNEKKNKRKINVPHLLSGILTPHFESEVSVKEVKFNPNTGCSQALDPIKVARACNLVIQPIEVEEPEIHNMQGNTLTIR